MSSGGDNANGRAASIKFVIQDSSDWTLLKRRALQLTDKLGKSKDPWFPLGNDYRNDVCLAATQCDPIYLEGPEYDLVNTYKVGADVKISWFPVTGATHYRVCIGNTVIASHKIVNSVIGDPSVIKTHGPSNLTTFSTISNLITETSYTFTPSDRNNIYVFAYNSVRGVFPKKQLYISSDFKEIWPTVLHMYSSNTWNSASTTETITLTNLYTNQSITRFMYQANDPPDPEDTFGYLTRLPLV